MRLLFQRFAGASIGKLRLSLSALVVALALGALFQTSLAEESVDSVSRTDSSEDSSATASALVGLSDSESGASKEGNKGAVKKELGVFNHDRWNALILILFFSGAIVFFTRLARQGKKIFVRKIPGVEAVEEAVGRATEMGRTVLFIPGIQELDDIQTIAGVTILGRVARITAEYDTPLVVPVRYPLVYVGAQEVVEQSYIEVGRQDSYNQDIVRYVAGEQFAYTAHVNGWMVREKPAANIYMGAFFAESLLLAETGHSAGSIQIAGTAEVAQLPFFIAACDYTLIGEELFAATAYLSRDPLQLGGLKGQDFTKALIIVSLLVGALSVWLLPDTLGKWMINAWTIK